MKSLLRALSSLVVLLVSVGLTFAQQPSVQERALMLKASLAASRVILKQYEWIETTVVSLKGEEKSRKQERCYYGADGQVQKVTLTAPPPEQKKRGLRGLIASSKKKKLAAYMEEAVSLVKSYLPLDPSRIQAAKEAGKVSFTPLPGERARLTFADYLKAGDSVTIEVNLANNRPLAANVSTFIESPKDAVTLDVRFGTLDNIATYTSTIDLEAKAKHVTVKVQNSGHRRP